MSIISLYNLSENPLTDSQIKKLLNYRIEYYVRFDSKKYAPIFIEYNKNNFLNLENNINELFFIIKREIHDWIIYHNSRNGRFTLEISETEGMIFHYAQDYFIQKLRNYFSYYNLNISFDEFSDYEYCFGLLISYKLKF